MLATRTTATVRPVSSRHSCIRPPDSNADSERACRSVHPVDVVEAAGGLVWRPVEGGVEVLLVHRPLRDDWTLPVGRVEPGEDLGACALREVREESGYTCEIGPLLTVLEVPTGDRIHRFHIFEMTAVSGEFVPNPETDDVVWLSPHQAAERATYENVRSLLSDVGGSLPRHGSGRCRLGQRRP